MNHQLVSRKAKTYVLVLLVCIGIGVLLTSCPPPGDTEADIAYAMVEKAIIAPQIESYQLFEQLLDEMDTTEALKSVKEHIMQDTMVEDCYSGSQGIWIDYKDGYRGGLFIDPLYRTGDESEDNVVLSRRKPGDLSEGAKDSRQANQTVRHAAGNYVTPGSKKTLMICSSYDNSIESRKKEVDQMLSNYNDRLPAVKFDPPILISNDQVTVDLFKKLTGYGIIHFTCHGMAWPDTKDIQKVYMQTGESFSKQTFKDNFYDIRSGKITLSSINSTLSGVKFFVSGDFVGSHNDFTKDTTLFYSGMCFGWLGEWPEALVHRANAGGYLGFDWSVWKYKEVVYNYHLFIDLCDIYQSNPITVDKWMTNEVRKWYWDEWDEKAIYINYLGKYPNLCLWRTKDDVSIDPADYLYCVWYVDNMSLKPVMVGTKADFKKKQLCSSYPGGGNDPSLLMDKVMMTEGHNTEDEAIEAACKLFDDVYRLPGSSTFVFTTWLGWIGNVRHDCDELGGCGN